jgi:glycine cleavage system H protein
VATFYYTETHEYFREEDGSYYLGISEHAQSELGDITYVELPAVDTEFAKGDTCCTVESVKAVAEIYAALAMKVVAVNERLEDEPELVNKDATGEGWLIKIELSDTSELSSLMDQAQYDAMEK